ncbi:MAG: transglutaminase-like domain-containing protein [Mesotoga sp.]|jgi:hypothetical protein|uniref:transglutaminase-like domain-containing protein n=1 Tax=Mesotoga sp. TaxID=2053577 RepID=UPI00169A7875|nr:transglutaminase-like domain-containing protein [Mesotoga sp.]MDI9368993.1 transglutaminase-like domain-containing protein [Thermotogota bacterium]NLT45787.1 transglutaminase domain-containing protein [Thermotogaceae bacterium]MDD2333270.1 transglutaminase-like domain-containing protein [Mesotoga sp.]MDD3681670.1 transglutaminase-like domain-containing protein [Mesotoga sp.]MDD4206341.1 transglutaminase-like domain-containing protein [Mesotoga sp.]
MRKVFVLFNAAFFISTLFSSIDTVKIGEYPTSQKNIKESFNYSIYYEHHIGDCGIKSMFFAALFRSIGIPARTLGGFQIFSGQLGSQFPDVFSLPNYGWVPVDTSAGQIVNNALNVADDERKALIAIFWELRTSKDDCPELDGLELEEGPFDIQCLGLAMQLPFIDCEIGNEDLFVSFAVLEGFSMNSTLIR